jgi:hypothetical protein
MAMTFEITEMQDILVVSIKGNPRVDDIKQILDQTRNTSGYSHSTRLWDFRESSFSFSQNEVLDIASTLPRMHQRKTVDRARSPCWSRKIYPSLYHGFMKYSAIPT